MIDGGDLMGYTPTNQIGNTKKPTMTRDEKPATHKIGIAGHWVKIPCNILYFHVGFHILIASTLLYHICHASHIIYMVYARLYILYDKR